VNTIWQGRINQAAIKYGDQAPMVAVCCNACRTCVSTNVIGLAFAAFGGVALAVTRFARRLAGPA
jgi:drug/metabolite transporter superfamily protein YnfA